MSTLQARVHFELAFSWYRECIWFRSCQNSLQATPSISAPPCHAHSLCTIFNVLYLRGSLKSSSRGNEMFRYQRLPSLTLRMFIIDTAQRSLSKT